MSAPFRMEDVIHGMSREFDADIGLQITDSTPGAGAVPPVSVAGDAAAGRAGDGGDDAGGRHLADAVVAAVGDVQAAVRPDVETSWQVERSRRGGATVAAEPGRGPRVRAVHGREVLPRGGRGRGGATAFTSSG